MSSNLSFQQQGSNNPITVVEFVPKNNNDPILSELRRLFVCSFYEYYKTIESQLNLPVGESLLAWLEKAFDEEADELLSHKCRCLLASTFSPSPAIVGFLTIKESKTDPDDIYLSQCAVDPEFKRKGYGLLLLKHLITMFPSTASYVCLCRRVNKPALKFYEKCGAKLIENDQIATNYGYNPVDYLGFQFSSSQLESH
jgi:ribosomal protein S18 acetylase RimI-like enzyme